MHGRITNKITWVHPLALFKSFDKTPDYLRFDSQFEAETYIALKKAFPLSKIETQYPIKILPPAFNGKHEDALYWKCDFALFFHKAEPPVLIEAKGNWIQSNAMGMQDFKKTLRLLDWFGQGQFHSLIIVSPKKQIKFDKIYTSIAFKDLIPQLHKHIFF